MGSTTAEINISLISPVREIYNPTTLDNTHFKGRVWINTVTDEVFICSECSTGSSATWIKIGKNKSERLMYGMIFDDGDIVGCEYNYNLKENYKPEMKAMIIDTNGDIIDGITGIDYDDFIVNINSAGSSVFWIYDEIDPNIPQPVNIGIYPFFLARVRGRANAIIAKSGYARGNIKSLKHCYENLSIYAQPDKTALRTLMNTVLLEAGVATQMPTQVNFDTNILDFADIFWLSGQSKGERLCNFPKVRKAGDSGSHSLLLPAPSNRYCFDTITGNVIVASTGHTGQFEYEYAGFYGYADNQLGNVSIDGSTGARTAIRKSIINRIFATTDPSAVTDYGYIGIFLFRDQSFPERYIIQLKPLTCDSIVVDYPLEKSGGRIEYDLEVVIIDQQGRMRPIKYPLVGSRFNLDLIRSLVDPSSSRSVKNGFHHFPKVFFRYRDKTTGKVGKLSQTGVTINLWEKGGRVPYRLRTIQQAL